MLPLLVGFPHGRSRLRQPPTISAISATQPFQDGLLEGFLKQGWRRGLPGFVALQTDPIPALRSSLFPDAYIRGVTAKIRSIFLAASTKGVLNSSSRSTEPR